ncbi:MAG: histidine kinase, partial [Bacteroidales bacterium]|nr:histidine kinase [Bacteroidales bacterium]
TSLQKAGDQFLIAVTAGGIDLIHTENGAVYPLSNAYGLGSFQPDLNVICQDQNKTIYIGTPFGLQILSQVEELGYRKAALFLNELQSFGEKLSEKALIKLTSRQNQLSASYTALWYPQPERLQFASKLAGYDQEYRLTRERQIHYNALEPGNYTLKIKLSGLPSYLPQPEISQQIKILLPFWKRWYVWIPGLLILIFIGLLFVRQRIQKIRKEQQLRRERAEFEYQNLRNQVNPHFLFNSFSTLMALIEENGTEALEYTEQLSDYFRQILQFRDTELISLKEELQLLENYLALQKKRYGDGLKMEISLDDNALNSLIPPMSLQMLAENALKHNQASRLMPLQISLSINTNELVFCNPLQPKQNTEKSTGLGIKNIAERYLNFANKHIRVHKNETHFCIYLPLIFK